VNNMKWQTILKEEKPEFNMDGDNHIDILMDLQKLLRDEIVKAEREFEKFVDDMNKNHNYSGASGKLPLGEIVNAGVKAFDEIINDTESSIKAAMTSINDTFKEHYKMVSPSTEGEIEHEENTDRQQDAYREQMAESYHADYQDPSDYYD